MNISYSVIIVNHVFFSCKAPEDEEIDFCVDGMRGKILITNDCVGQAGTLLSPVRNLPRIEENVVFCARFRDPAYSCDFIFKAKRYT